MNVVSPIFSFLRDLLPRQPSRRSSRRNRRQRRRADLAYYLHTLWNDLIDISLTDQFDMIHALGYVYGEKRLISSHLSL